MARAGKRVQSLLIQKCILYKHETQELENYRREPEA